MDTQLDPTVVNLAKAIRQRESGGDFKASGKSGEYGAYQYTPDTWNAAAPKYGITSKLEDATPEQQNAVTYNRIKAWKDKGHDVTEIASMWNAGEGEPKAYTGKFGSTTKTHKAGDPSKGVNSYGAKYDVPAYAASIAEAYQTFKSGGQAQQDLSNPSAVQQPTEPQKPDALQSTIQGIAKPFLSTIASGQGLYNSGKGIVKAILGKDVSAEKAQDIKLRDEGQDFGYFGKAQPIGAVKGGIHSVGDFAKGVGSSLKTGLELAPYAAGAAGIQRLYQGARALGNPTVKQLITDSIVGGKGMNPASLGKIKITETYDALHNALRAAESQSQKDLLVKAIEELKPLYLKEAGLAPSLLKKSASLVGKGLGGLTKLGLQGAGFGSAQGLINTLFKK